MKNQTFAQISEQSITLSDYLLLQPKGALLSYTQIESDTGVKMDDQGKSYLRTALKRSKIEYTPIKGHGIELACVDNAMGIVGQKLNRVSSSIKRAEKTHLNIKSQFYNELSDEDKQNSMMIGIAFATMNHLAKESKSRTIKDGVANNERNWKTLDI